MHWRPFGMFVTMASLALLCGSLRGFDAATSQSANASSPPDTEMQSATQLRRPVALAFVDQGERLLVANRRSGSVSVVDPKTNSVTHECPLGQSIADLAVHPRDDRRLLAVDEAAHELLLIDRVGTKLSVASRCRVPDYPVSVKFTSDGRRALVTSLWSRQLTVVDLPDDGTNAANSELTVAKSIPLPFAPRLLVFLEKARRAVVADSFGGNLALIGVAAGTVESVRTLPAHNIRGLALSADGERLLVSHQTLNPEAQTSFEDIHWGRLMINVAHSLDLEAVLNPQSELLRGSRTIRLGDVGQAAADPAGICVAPENGIAIAFSGVDEVAFLKEGHPGQLRIRVGKCPTAVAIDPNNARRAYVANTLDDSLSVLDLSDADRHEALTTINLGPQPELTQAEQGEVLFHDARLSHDGWMSCQSCHTDGHSNGLLNDNRGDGSFEAPKRVLSLLGVAATAPWAWNGSSPDLAAQVKKSVRTTMHGPAYAKELTDEQVAALTEYVRTLPAPPPMLPARNADDEAAIARGKELFRELNCIRCHAPPNYTSAGVYDVGLADELGNTQYNPPSLRGVSQRDRLFHDNRATSLEDLLTQHRHQLAEPLDPPDLADLIRFLRNL